MQQWSLSQEAAVDKTTQQQVAIDDPHHHLHEGHAFLCFDVLNVDETTQKWMITTPDSAVVPHMVFEVEGTGEISILITEGADRIGSTALSYVNRNRLGSPPSSDVVVHRGITGGSTDGATEIENIRSGISGQGGKSVSAGGSRGVNEFNLARDTKYVIAVETFADIYVTLHLDWYDHESLL